ncbi:MAG: hypothetical protein F7C35_01405 [Desulfurococcales archaeon]|nr:hypothetical protein [Desulfurococcales archaeon]
MARESRLRIALWGATRGVIEGLLAIIIYIYLLPQLFMYIYEKLGYSGYPGYDIVSSKYLTFIILILGLSTTAKILKKTIFDPILRASANMFGILFVISFLGSGSFTLKNLPAGDFKADITLDLSPLLTVFFIFFVVPSVIAPFIDYFYEMSQSEE